MLQDSLSHRVKLINFQLVLRILLQGCLHMQGKWLLRDVVYSHVSWVYNLNSVSLTAAQQC